MTDSTTGLFPSFRFVQTDMGNAGAKFVGMAEAPITLDDATAFIVAQVSLPTWL